jgi:MFS transporter, FSR family, fosmidomycin resistance protein
MIWVMVPLVALLALVPIVLAGLIVVIVAVGFAPEGPFSTTVVLGQEYLPDRVGLAAGVTYGTAMGMGGLLASARSHQTHCRADHPGGPAIAAEGSSGFRSEGRS